MRHQNPMHLIAPSLVLALALCAGGCATPDTATADRVTVLEERVADRVTGLEDRVADLEARNDALEKKVAESAVPPPIRWYPTIWPKRSDAGLPRVEIPYVRIGPVEPGDCALPLPEPLKVEIR